MAWRHLRLIHAIQASNTESTSPTLGEPYGMRGAGDDLINLRLNQWLKQYDFGWIGFETLPEFLDSRPSRLAKLHWGALFNRRL